jgi:hypothetical protein
MRNGIRLPTNGSPGTEILRQFFPSQCLVIPLPRSRDGGELRTRKVKSIEEIRPSLFGQDLASL